MEFLKLFEEFEGEHVSKHLKLRGVDSSKTRYIIDEETEDVYFFLYNLSGQMVGYQKYNPNYEKIGQRGLSNPRMAKYFNIVTDDGDGSKKIAVWGLESTKFTDKYLFITEGIFDAARIQEAGYPAIAVLCNNPSNSLKSWLDTMPQKKIVIYDNDKPGRLLIKVGDYAYTVPEGKDINDLNPTDAKKFIEECLLKINLES
jgi:DNA primase